MAYIVKMVLTDVKKEVIVRIVEGKGAVLYECDIFFLNAYKNRSGKRGICNEIKRYGAYCTGIERHGRQVHGRDL